MSQADVSGGIFRRAIVAVARRDCQDGWLSAKQVEKAEWGGVDISLWADRRDKRNRTRRYETRQNLVCPVGIIAFQIKFHEEQNATALAGQSTCANHRRAVVSGGVYRQDIP